MSSSGGADSCPLSQLQSFLAGCGCDQKRGCGQEVIEGCPSLQNFALFLMSSYLAPSLSLFLRSLSSLLHVSRTSSLRLSSSSFCFAISAFTCVSSVWSWGVFWRQYLKVFRAPGMQWTGKDSMTDKGTQRKVGPMQCLHTSKTIETALTLCTCHSSQTTYVAHRHTMSSGTPNTQFPYHIHTLFHPIPSLTYATHAQVCTYTHTLLSDLLALIRAQGRTQVVT